MIRKWCSRMRSSIFTQLIVVSVGTGLGISLSVAAFFLMIVRHLLPNASAAQQLEFHRMHDRMLVGLLILVVSVVIGGHAALRRLLSPVRLLTEGAIAISEGNLDVKVARRTHDELGALTDSFNKMVEQIREMVRARDQLLLDVSHELRSPLTRMKVALALCEDAEPVRRLHTHVDEMEALVVELLELERLRKGHGVQLQRHDLMEIVRDAIACFEDRAPGARVVRCPSEVWLHIDADKVRSVLGNLLENAAKYAHADSRPTEVVVHQPDSHRLELRVVDDGVGIPAADIPNLFEPFFRVDRSRSKRTGGYGLGLSICKRIMDAHGGNIVATNNPSRGASFTLVFRLDATQLE